MQLFDTFKLAKELEIRDGEIILMKSPVCFALTHILADFQKDLIEKNETKYQLVDPVMGRWLKRS